MKIARICMCEISVSSDNDSNIQHKAYVKVQHNWTMKRCGSNDRHNLSSGSFFQCDDAWIDTHTSTCRFKLSYIFIQTLIFSSFDNLCYFVLILFCSRFPSWCFDTCFSFAFMHSFLVLWKTFLLPNVSTFYIHTDPAVSQMKVCDLLIIFEITVKLKAYWLRSSN